MTTTTTPLSEESPWGLLRRLPIWGQISAAIIAALIVLTIIGAAVGPGHSSMHVPAGMVGGAMNYDLADGGQLQNAVKVDRVWCGWYASNGDVSMHFRFHNTSAASITVTYDTRYTVQNGGTHGDSARNTEMTDVAAGQTVSVLDDAGAPSGVQGGTPISGCSPQLMSVDTQ